VILKEYALDPTLINNWDKCRAFLGPFGVENGRQVSSFPKYKKWKDLLIRNLDAKPKEKLMIVEYLTNKRNSEKSFVTKSRTYINSKEWLKNADIEQSSNPFQAVISTENNTYNHNNFISDNDFSDIHALMEANVNAPICRNVRELTRHIIPLLDQSRTIIFVDPYFYGTKNKFLDPLTQFLKIIANNPQGLKRVSIQYHHNDGGTIANPTDIHNIDDIVKRWGEKIQSILPENVAIQFHMWPFKDLHNRYILTDVYGVSYGRGLSKDNSGFADKDEILGLGLEVWRERFGNFLNNVAEPYMELSKL